VCARALCVCVGFGGGGGRQWGWDYCLRRLAMAAWPVAASVFAPSLELRDDGAEGLMSMSTYFVLSTEMFLRHITKHVALFSN
jgi:hypothetical protein